MSAAFSLDYSGPQVRCDFPRCTLNAFHEGDHHLAPIQRTTQQPIYTCIVCGAKFVVYGQVVACERHLCGERECLELYARAEARLRGPLPITCRCPQREYPHELTVHHELHYERHNPARRFHWPWSLMLSEHIEPSTERAA